MIPFTPTVELRKVMLSSKSCALVLSTLIMEMYTLYSLMMPTEPGMFLFSTKSV